MEAAEQGVVRDGGPTQKEECGSDGKAEEAEQQVKRVQAECNGMADGFQKAAVTTV